MAECPFCEYESSSSSVEAHVSGCTDEDHKGKLGSNYRGIIEASVGRSADDGDRADEPDGDLPPGLVLVAATAVLAVIVIAGSSGSASVEEPVDEDDEPDGWA